MLTSFVSASTMKITTVHNVAISRGLGSVSDYGDQELAKLGGIGHLVTTVKPEVILGLMLLKNLDVFFSPPPKKKKTTHTPYFIHTVTFILIYMLGLCLMRLVHEC